MIVGTTSGALLIASMTEDEAIATITPNLQHYVDGDLTTGSSSCRDG